jgi:hypothetical protein
MIMAILSMLFATRMVPSSLSGFESRCRAVAGRLPFFCCSSSRSFGEREKYATSEPEIKAEAIIRIIRKMISVISAKSTPVTVVSEKKPACEHDNSVSKIRELY